MTDAERIAQLEQHVVDLAGRVTRQLDSVAQLACIVLALQRLALVDLLPGERPIDRSTELLN